ncbi:MATE family efflux transporter [Populibacterium corticicola]|uniref:MATE family efflux transporter n=1 Tax=Populibacterium corticicola TaxID=1812826 RepID=A0ABW5XIP6_9MICO
MDNKRTKSGYDRQILALAIPSLGALIAEPLFVLIDTAIVGHLGETPLAGLSIASTLLLTIVGLCVFLAYATTSSVARLIGAGQRERALKAGIDGLWLALGLGILLAVGFGAAAPWILGLLGASDALLVEATSYLRWSVPGLPGMLIVMAATGVLRGFKDTKTPLVVAVVGAIVNTVLSVVLVYGLNMGVAGSGAGTAITQIGMGLVLATVVVRKSRAENISLRPAPAGILASARSGVPLFIRTISLRAALLVTIFVATHLGTTALAGHQVVNALWNFAAFALDALAIAAQALVGQAVGARDKAATAAVLRRTLQWGVGAGVVLGAIMAGLSPFIAPLFSSEPSVQRAVIAGLIAAAVFMPIAGWVFILDGVLMGAGDGVYLAKVGMINLAVYVPVAFAVYAWAPSGAAGLVWLWVAFGLVYTGARAVANGVRLRSDAWTEHAL